MENPTLTKTVFLAASRETVWSYLTEKDKLVQWFNPSDVPMEDNLTMGEEFAVFSDANDGTKLCWGSVLEMDPPSRLSYSFTVGPLNGAMTNVAWTLEEAHGGTVLTLEHEGIANAAGEAAFGLLSGIDAGWDRYLGALRGSFKD